MIQITPPEAKTPTKFQKFSSDSIYKVSGTAPLIQITTSEDKQTSI
eukprot:UN10498